MIKGSENRQPEHSVERIFVDRWSPRAMSGEELSDEVLQTLFEAARWAPSSGNNQPWRMLYAPRTSL
jgi:nitroreductase